MTKLLMCLSLLVMPGMAGDRLATGEFKTVCTMNGYEVPCNPENLEGMDNLADKTIKEVDGYFEWAPCDKYGDCYFRKPKPLPKLVKTKWVYVEYEGRLLTNPDCSKTTEVGSIELGLRSDGSVVWR